MFALIVGGGKVGSYLSQSLLADGHKVVVLEKRREICAKLNKEVDTSVIKADGCDPESLEQAGINQADIVVAVTGDDEDNLVVSQLAKYTFGVDRVIARVNNPRNHWLFDRQWGVDVAVSAVHITSKIIQEEATLGDIVTLLKLRKGELSLVEITVSSDSKAVSKPIKDLTLPKESVFVALVRDQEILIPRGETVIQAGDELLALTSTSAEKELVKKLSVIGKK
jgi:trk system potassium uptake protein TrkA